MQYKLAITISDDFDEDESETISFALMDALETISKKSKENISTSKTLDYLIWCDPYEFNRTSKLYRKLKKEFRDFSIDEGIEAQMRKLVINRKMLVLKIESE